MNSKFVIDDQHIYHYATDFRSPQAKAQFKKYLQLKESYHQQQSKLENIRTQYSRANQNEKAQMAPAILDLEKTCTTIGHGNRSICYPSA